MTNPTLCHRTHPHLAQSPHCDLREVSAFLTQRAALGTAISPDDLKSMAAQIDRVAAGLPVEATAEPQPHPDDLVVDALAAAMKAKLSKKRAQGYGGWDTDCTQERLSDLLRSHVDKGDPLDVANYCAFLHARREWIAPATQVLQSTAQDSPADWPEARPVTGEELQEIVREAASDLIDFANAHGCVVTIETKPLAPLAMGHYEMVSEVRASRGRQMGGE